MLTGDQETAISAIREFLKGSATSFLLEGGAGVGKTFLLGQVLHESKDGIRCVATPTHKATNVIRKKLEAFEVSWQRGFDSYDYDGESVVTGTTAQLLGIRPVVSDDQTTDEVRFGHTNTGILAKCTPRLLIIDEVSMLGVEDFVGLMKRAKESGMKIIAVGDAAQLPPVKKTAIPFENFKWKAALRQIVRQAEGSAIITLAWALRDGKPWREIRGAGVRRVASVADAFVEVVKAVGERPEEEREVFVAYRNRVVDEVQERVCQKVYGHGESEFATGELVLSETNFYRGKVLMCANQDELVVEKFYEDLKDPTTGVPVQLRHRGKMDRFTANYLSPAEFGDKQHPFNVELRKRTEYAQRLQQLWKVERDPRRRAMLDADRKKGWRDFFEWRDATIISFRHPFAITSHKSQGSTYKSVYADVNDLGQFSSAALYVAVTRPKEELVF